ncbi:MAG: PASTA domain-containing protein [Acidimicrobiia bacterium]
MRTSGVADLAGRVLAGRYRLVAPIGTGASGRVYAAWDVRLRRRVAVKVLHAALADDAGFLRRFGAEAQLAASLHHPGVVDVYDWGEDDTAFMVLELLEGGSLRGLLDRGERLTPAQAAAVGRQVAAALAHAHARGLVHRDVKPANLLFDEHGDVRVADFGLARALAEASWTEPAGAVMGTARYAAPEQVRGTVDARSDCYSLALVLVEAVTGEVPFGAETSLSGLLSRVDRPLTVPPELGPLVPVLELAGRAAPEERYPDAAAFAAALTDAAAQLPAPVPLVLPTLYGAGADPHPTELGSAAIDDATFIGAPSPAPPPARAAFRRRGRTGRSLLPILVVLLVAAAGATAAFALTRAAGPRVRVPNLVGSTYEEARTAAGRADLEVRRRPRTAADPAGTVIGQDPEPGTVTNTGRPLVLFVSSGPPPVALPGVTGTPEADARATLEGAGFEVAVTSDYHEEIAAGSVIGQNPAEGEEVSPGSQVDLVVSLGARPVTVPNVVGETYDDAEESLTGSRLKAKRAEAFSDSVPAGEVIRQDPVAGEEAPRDSEVTVVVSKGPDIVEVPDVRGEDVTDAVRQLEALGFEVDVVGFRFDRPVRRQDPDPGDEVKRGETVTLYQ